MTSRCCLLAPKRTAQLFLGRYGGVVLRSPCFVDTQRKRWVNGVERLWLMATPQESISTAPQETLSGSSGSDGPRRAALRSHPLLCADVCVLPVSGVRARDERHARGEVRPSPEGRHFHDKNSSACKVFSTTGTPGSESSRNRNSGGDSTLCLQPRKWIVKRTLNDRPIADACCCPEWRRGPVSSSTHGDYFAEPRTMVFTGLFTHAPERAGHGGPPWTRSSL